MNRKLVCLTLDMEPDYGDPDRRIRLLDNQEYFDRYTGIIQKYNAKVTMFTVTSLFEGYGKKFELLSQTIPLEFSAHSHSHDPNNAASRDEIEKSINSFQRYTGHAPIGYRAPFGQIDKTGLQHLLNFGFRYDASIYTSFRPGKFGYSNMTKPNIPFRITQGDKQLIEFPFTSLSGIRIVFGLSYIKLLGWKLFSALWNIFGIPDIVLALSHPHDFYFHELEKFHSLSAEKIALSRNAKHAFTYFERMVRTLTMKGYEFVFVSEAYDYVQNMGGLREIPLTNWN